MDKSLKEKVLESVDIVDVIAERVALTRKGRELLGLCPFHPDRKPSLSVSPQKQIFKCWSCGAGGDVIRFIQLIESCDFRSALQSLARRANIATDQREAAPGDRGDREKLLAAIRWAQKRFQDHLHNADVGRAVRDYLRRRGLSDPTIEHLHLGLARDAWNDLLDAARAARIPDSELLLAGLITRNDAGRTYDRFRNRLVFPIADSSGRPIAFGGRTLGDDPAKYLNSPETPLFSKSRVLYAFDSARRAITEQRTAVIVEGYMDVAALYEHGFSNVVATLGTSLTDAHAKLLRNVADRIYLCFDGDDAGTRAANRAVEVALRTRGVDVRVVILPAGQDPADCVSAGGPEAFSACLNRSSDALEFKWQQTLSAFGHGGPRAKRAAAEDFLQFVATATAGGGIDPLDQNLLAGRLGDLLGVTPDAVFELLVQAKRQQRRPQTQATSDTNTESDYLESIRGIPEPVVTATETVLGLLASDPQTWTLVDDSVSHAVAYSQTWKALYRILLDVHDELGEYSFRDVLTQCHDGATCELVSRARARTAGVQTASEDMAAACRRLANEIGVLQWAELRAAGGELDDDAFETLRRQSPRTESSVPPDGRIPVAKGRHDRRPA